MPTYTLHAVNVGAFPIGETDKVITLFSAERGIVRAVAKGARKPGSKIAGRAELLNVNRLLVATGRSLEIISQAETIESFHHIRTDLTRLSFCLYYAELTHHFGLGLADESASYFDFLCDSIRSQNQGLIDPVLLCLDFEANLLQWLGYQPELSCCVACRDTLTDYRIAKFHFDLGGILCDRCSANELKMKVAEDGTRSSSYYANESVHITPLVWKRLILAGNESPSVSAEENSQALERANQAARRVMQGYIEFKAGKKMKSLELIGKM